MVYKLHETNEGKALLLGAFFNKGDFLVVESEGGDCSLLMMIANSLTTGVDFFGCKVHEKVKCLYIQRRIDIRWHWNMVRNITGGTELPVIEMDKSERIDDAFIDFVTSYCKANDIQVVLVEYEHLLGADKSKVEKDFEYLKKLSTSNLSVVALANRGEHFNLNPDWTMYVRKTEYAIDWDDVYDVFIEDTFIVRFCQEETRHRIIEREVRKTKTK